MGETVLYLPCRPEHQRRKCHPKLSSFALALTVLGVILEQVLGSEITLKAWTCHERDNMNKPDYTKSPTGSDAWVSEMEFYQTENYMDREKDNHLQGDLIWTKRWELKLKGIWSSKIQKNPSSFITTDCIIICFVNIQLCFETELTDFRTIDLSGLMSFYPKIKNEVIFVSNLLLLYLNFVQSSFWYPSLKALSEANLPLQNWLCNVYHLFLRHLKPFDSPTL